MRTHLLEVELPESLHSVLPQRWRSRYRHAQSAAGRSSGPHMPRFLTSCTCKHTSLLLLLFTGAIESLRPLHLPGWTLLYRFNNASQ